ncbi:DUF1819 domain-containing protein [Lactobacillus sp. CBA3605]|uniref:DUF1819 family protein n=1 Tax=Lactobacillus sp. CBA3605 TaxID=2099788 RepID=UPI000CFC86E4|nr:DUF1819 family protein [Lactobacillus sp. CBA3605]AVK61137.1 DUF1819 domain-containing protein [Lactobacillus sp. CBA3605]
MIKYSAAIVSHSFWFNEFQQYIELLNKGLTQGEINSQAIKDNIFKQSTVARIQDMLKIITHRIDSLDQDYMSLFPRLDIANQRLIDLITVMKSNQLFEEFMYEVYRDELVLGDTELHDYEIEAFFSRKQAENQQIASWTDETITRLMGVFKTFVREAGLMKNQGSFDQVSRPLLDLDLEDMLRNKDEHQILAVLLGR